MSELDPTRNSNEAESLNSVPGEALSASDLALGFVGNPSAKIDERGRLKMPTEFRQFVEKKYGAGFKEFYVASTDGLTGELYPMPEWNAHLGKVFQMPRLHPARVKLLANYTLYGDKAEMDPQGRMQLPEKLRVTADLAGEVKVSGEGPLLRITSVRRLEAEAEARKIELTADDFAALSNFGL